MSVNYIASAGTGKTSKLIDLVIDKILDENLSLKEMLIITFTEKAASELKDKIVKRIYKDISGKDLKKEDRVKLHRQILYLDSGYIGTFHSIFLKLLKLYPLTSKIDNSFGIISNEDLKSFINICFERWIWEDTEKDETPWKKIIRDTNKTQKDIKRIFIEIYQNKLKIDLKKVDTYDKDYIAGTILKKFLDFSEFVKREKEKVKKLDFDDIIERMAEVLKDSQTKESIRSKFKYIFIDEFQDTDRLQVNIIKEISKDNLYIFGDPKQSIYEFRQADLDFYFNFVEEGFKKEHMELNHRSSPMLVDFYNELFSYSDFFTPEHIKEDYRRPIKTSDKERFKGQESYVKLYRMKDIKTNNKDEIIELHAKATAVVIKKLTEKGHSYGDFMVLFFRNKEIETFSGILNTFGIPNIPSSQKNLFEQSCIRTLIDILKFIDFPDDKMNTVRILKLPSINIPDREIYDNRDDLFNISHPVFDLLKELSVGRYSISLEDIFQGIWDNLEDILWFHIEDKSYPNTLKYIRQFKNLVRRKTQEGYSLRDFILLTETSFVPAEDENDHKNSVWLMTMHKSKGLQSKIVIIPMIDLFPADLPSNEIIFNDGKLVLNFKNFKSPDIDKTKDILESRILNERKRLFYVATTRATHKLIFTSSDTDNPHSFKNMIEQHIGNSHIEEEWLDIDHLEGIAVKEDKNKDENYDSDISSIRKMEEQLENSYKQAQNTYRFLSVSKIMEMENKDGDTHFKKNEESIGVYVGTLVHLVLEEIDLHNFTFERAKELALEKEKLVAETVRKDVMEMSLELLRKFESSDILRQIKSSEIVFKELPFTLYEDGKFIDGRIDIVYRKGDKLVVLDYKTNRFETQEEKQNILKIYEKQKEYYLKAVKKLFKDEDVEFKLGLVWSGEVL